LVRDLHRPRALGEDDDGDLGALARGGLHLHEVEAGRAVAGDAHDLAPGAAELRAERRGHARAEHAELEDAQVRARPRRRQEPVRPERRETPVGHVDRVAAEGRADRLHHARRVQTQAGPAVDHAHLLLPPLVRRATAAGEEARVPRACPPRVQPRRQARPASDAITGQPSRSTTASSASFAPARSTPEPAITSGRAAPASRSATAAIRASDASGSGARYAAGAGTRTLDSSPVA